MTIDGGTVVGAHPYHRGRRWIGLATQVENRVVIRQRVIDILARLSIDLDQPDDRRFHVMTCGRHCGMEQVDVDLADDVRRIN